MSDRGNQEGKDQLQLPTQMNADFGIQLDFGWVHIFRKNLRRSVNQYLQREHLDFNVDPAALGRVFVRTFHRQQNIHNGCSLSSRRPFLHCDQHPAGDGRIHVFWGKCSR